MTSLAVATGANRLAQDALMELVNIGSGNALSSLSRLVGGDCLMPSVPEMMTSEAVTDLADLDADGIVVSMTVVGAVECVMMMLFEQRSALELVAELLNRDPLMLRLGPEEEGALAEAVNIISCSFLGALASMLRGVLIPSPPTTAQGRLADVTRDRLGAGTWALTNRFAAVRGGLSGRVVLTGDDVAAGKILAALGVSASAS